MKKYYKWGRSCCLFYGWKKGNSLYSFEVATTSPVKEQPLFEGWEDMLEEITEQEFFKEYSLTLMNTTTGEIT